MPSEALGAHVLSVLRLASVGALRVVVSWDCPKSVLVGNIRDMILAHAPKNALIESLRP